MLYTLPGHVKTKLQNLKSILKTTTCGQPFTSLILTQALSLGWLLFESNIRAVKEIHFLHHNKKGKQRGTW